MLILIANPPPLLSHWQVKQQSRFFDVKTFLISEFFFCNKSTVNQSLY